MNTVIQAAHWFTTQDEIRAKRTRARNKRIAQQHLEHRATKPQKPRARQHSVNAKHAEQRLVDFPYDLVKQKLAQPTTGHMGLRLCELQELVGAIHREAHPGAQTLHCKNLTHVLRHCGWWSAPVTRRSRSAAAGLPPDRVDTAPPSKRKPVNLWFPPTARVHRTRVEFAGGA